MKSIVALIALLMLFGTMGFAGVIVDDSFEIIEPAMNESDRLVVKDRLLISMRFLEEREARLSLYRIAEVLPDLDEMEFEQTTGTSVNVFDLVYEQDWVTIDEDEEGQVSLQFVDGEREERQQIVLRYFDLKRLLEGLEKEYELLSKEEMLTEMQDVHANGLEELEEKIEVTKQAFRTYRRQYRDLFKVTVLDNIPVVKEGILPYFKTTVEDVKPGTYHLVLENMQGERLFDRRLKIEKSDEPSPSLVDGELDRQLQEIFLPKQP